MIWCLHGAVGMAADWKRFAERMVAGGHEVRRVDLWEYVEERGCSLSEFGERLCERVRLEDPAPCLLGYSMGGRLALHALLAEPSLWRAAVIVSAHPGLEHEEDRIMRMAADAQWAADSLTMNWDEFVRKWKAQPVLRESGEEGLGDRTMLKRRHRAVARGFVEWSLGKQDDLRGRMGEIGCPVLWVNGAEDEKFCRLGVQAVSELMDGRQVIIPGAGHRVPWEAPGEFVGEVTGMLGRGQDSGEGRGELG